MQVVVGGGVRGDGGRGWGKEVGPGLGGGREEGA